MRPTATAWLWVVGLWASPAPAQVPAAPAPRPVEDPVRVLFARLNDDPDQLHWDYTPAVHDLIEVGPPALPRAVELMLSDDWETRLRAQRVLEGVTARRYGFVPGRGWTRPGGQDEMRRFWASLGDLNYKDPPAKRAAAVERWRSWLDEASRRVRPAGRESASPTGRAVEVLRGHRPKLVPIRGGPRTATPPGGSNVFAWSNGWRPFAEDKPRLDLERELARELAGVPGHVLAGRRFVAVGRLAGSDDLILRLDDRDEFAWVHLTWNREDRPGWPHCELLGGVEAANTFIAGWESPPGDLEAEGGPAPGRA